MDVSPVAREHEAMPRTTDSEYWRTTLESEPEIMHRLLRDLWRASQAAKGADGRVSAPTIDEVFSLVIPEYSIEPFHLALQAKLGDRSVRWLEREIHCGKTHVHRWVTGKRPIVNLHDPRGSMDLIEAISKALGVHPAYFAEWRRLWILLLIDDAFTWHPNLSIGVWKKFAGLTDPRKPLVNGR